VRAPQALSTLAREMIELLSGPLSGRIRECASDNCPLVFVDSSRPGARRWCAMERCGNRHKFPAGPHHGSGTHSVMDDER
jgi:predicted RNA-binding Zn ribbon-like protein